MYIDPNVTVLEGNHWEIQVNPELTIEEAVTLLSKVMETLADHPNIDPMAFQGALMSAMMQQG